MEMECKKQDQELCPDPRSSSNNILTGHQALNRLEALPNFRTFKNGEEFAITELFHCLQCAHNAATETAGHLAFLGHTLQLEQFSFILKHSVHPLVQLQIPLEEAYEQKAINTILPCPHHPKLDDVDAKHPTSSLQLCITLYIKSCLTSSRSHNPEQLISF